MIIKEKIVPIPLAEGSTQAEPIPLHKPEPTCREWDARKKELERFLAVTSEPVEKMRESMKTMETAYASRTDKPLIANERDWPDDYKHLYEGLNTLVSARNSIVQELSKIKKTENQDKLISGLTEQHIMMTYCQKDREI